MPELPEVETVRQGLVPAMEGARIIDVRLNRPDLRFPFPDRFAERLTGRTVTALRRRAKYLIADVSEAGHLVMHLGMTGRFSISGQAQGQFYRDVGPEAHTHVVFTLESQAGEAVVSYADPRRFGFMDLVPPGELESSRHFAGMGVEPLSEDFTPEELRS
ncbi:MAG: DNA-formamidopyrimidine glycosylase family protein, partial [Pseudomonadota bacterium]